MWTGASLLGMTGLEQHRVLTGARTTPTEHDRDLGGHPVDNLCVTCCDGVDTTGSSGDSAVDNSAGAVDNGL